MSVWFDPDDSPERIQIAIRHLLYLLVVSEATRDRLGVEEGLQDFREEYMVELRS